jgi:hypothetical protein
MRGGIWIDTYNGIWNEEISGTITTRVDAASMFFVTELSMGSAEQGRAHPGET